MSTTLRIPLGVSRYGMNITLAAAGNQGQGARPYQEDSFGFSDISNNASLKKGFMAVLADGMGGLSDGAAVSRMAVDHLLSEFNRKSSGPTSGQQLAGSVARMNKDACARFCPNGKIASGSTVVVAHFSPDRLHWACVGDSRLYVKRGSRMYQVNEDHDYCNQLLNTVIDNKMSLGDAKTAPQAARLTSCIGNRALPLVDCDINGFHLMNGDVIVLCSDGTYNSLSEPEFASLIGGNPGEDVDRVINAINSKRYPHQDNLTVMIIKYN